MPQRRSFKHAARGYFVTSWFAPDRCFHADLKRFLEGLVSTKDLTMLGKKSGSSFHLDMDSSCKLTASPFTEYFEPLFEAKIPQKKMHYQIEKMMMMNHDTVVATELPLHGQNYEGLIDVVANTEDYIWILDYKPNAKRTNAIGQVSMYANLLGQLANIPLDHFMVGWFDEHHCYHAPPKYVELV